MKGCWNFFPRWKQKFQTFAQCAILVYFIYGGNVWHLYKRRKPDNNFSSRSHSLPRRKIFQFSIQPKDWMDDSRKVRIKAYYTPLILKISDNNETPFLLLFLKQRLEMCWGCLWQNLWLFRNFSLPGKIWTMVMTILIIQSLLAFFTAGIKG